jgi:hypothetical protein
MRPGLKKGLQSHWGKKNLSNQVILSTPHPHAAYTIQLVNIYAHIFHGDKTDKIKTVSVK